jgi:hypothetical protein
LIVKILVVITLWKIEIEGGAGGWNRRLEAGREINRGG